MDLHVAVRNVAVQAPEAPEPVVVQLYLDAAREFFERTRAWTDDDVLMFRDEYASRDNAGAFQLEPGTGREVIDARFMRFDDRPLEKQTTVQIRRRADRTGSPRFYRIARGAGLLHIAPDPGDDSDKISGEFVLLPSRDAQQLDDELVATYGEAIELGALYRLLRQPHQDWTNYDAAKMFGTEFHEKVASWRRRATDDGMEGVVRKTRYGGY